MALLVLLVVLAVALGTTASRNSDPIVTIRAGKVKGVYVESEGVAQWLGIPYAAPPTGENRFRETQKVMAWGSKVYNADSFKAACPQNCTTVKDVCPQVTSEDCLFINVWAPWSPPSEEPDTNAATKLGSGTNNLASTGLGGEDGDSLRILPKGTSTAVAGALAPKGKPFMDTFIPLGLVQESKAAKPKLPVMVFIHGGLFTLSHSGVRFMNGTALAQQGTLVVTFNYRLGALGFLATETLSGNYGFMDQVAALKWVKQNIEFFGGDPNRVTIAGQSAGAISVSLHVTSEASRGLFHRAILESPFPGLPFLTQEQSSHVIGHDFVSRVGCDHGDSHESVVACLKNSSVDAIVSAQHALVLDTSSVRKIYGTPYFSALCLPFGPVISGPVTDQPMNLFKRGTWNKVPIVAGFTRDEFASFLPVVIPELGKYSYDALVYAYFGLSVSGKILKEYPASEIVQDQRIVLGEVLRDMFVACPLRALVASSSAPTFLYRFDHVMKDPRVWSSYSSYCANYACHSSEVPMVFGGKDLSERFGAEGEVTAEEKFMAGSIQHYWQKFVSNEQPDPNGNAELATWPAASTSNSNILLIDTPNKLSSMSDMSRRCDMWDEIGYFW